MRPSSQLLNPPPKSYWKWVKFELVNDWALRHAHWISARTNTSKRGKDVTGKNNIFYLQFLRTHELFFYFVSFFTRSRSISRRTPLIYVWVLEKVVKNLLEILSSPKSGYTGDNFKFLPTTEIPLHTYRMILINLDTYPERINASNFLKRF